MPSNTKIKTSDQRRVESLRDQFRFEKMMETRTFAQLLASGDVLDVESARLRMGYTAWGLRRLCINGTMAHINYLGRYYFLPSQIKAAFKFVPAYKRA